MRFNVLLNVAGSAKGFCFSSPGFKCHGFASLGVAPDYAAIRNKLSLVLDNKPSFFLLERQNAERKAPGGFGNGQAAHRCGGIAAGEIREIVHRFEFELDGEARMLPVCVFRHGVDVKIAQLVIGIVRGQALSFFPRGHQAVLGFGRGVVQEDGRPAQRRGICSDLKLLSSARVHAQRNRRAHNRHYRHQAQAKYRRSAARFILSEPNTSVFRPSPHHGVPIDTRDTVR